MTDRIRIIKHRGVPNCQAARHCSRICVARLWRPEHGDSYEYAAMVPSAGPIEVTTCSS
jgi:hypothetical protein